MKTYKQLKESLSHDYVLQHLADKDINAHIKNGKVVVHPDDAAETRRHLKKIGHDHLRVTIKGADQVAESVEELDEIKLATVGKIIKHSPKIASAAIGAAVAAHSVDAPKQPVKASYSEFTKKIQKEEVELEEAKDTITKDASGKVTSWKHEGDWTKSNNKNAEGKVHNLVGQALKKTKELTKEEVELTEGKIPVEHAANSVGKVLGQHNAVKFLAHLKPGTEKHTSWDKINTALKSQGVQTHHIAKIAGHIKPVQFKEEVESLDELSKKTLGSYVKKATGGLNGVAHHAFNANEKIGRDSDDRAKSYSKAVKRIKGVEQATDKLTKEEVELDEVLDPSMGAGEYVKDFQKSDAPQFKGKSQEKRRIMGIAAYMAAKNK